MTKFFPSHTFKMQYSTLLATFTYTIINQSLRAVYYIPVTYLFSNWELSLLILFIHLAYPPPPAPGNHQPHSPIDGHLGCFRVFAIVKNAAVFQSVEFRSGQLPCSVN